MNIKEEPSSATPRSSWNLSRSVRIANSGEPGIIAGTMISANTTKRIQVISIDGSVFAKYLAVTSEVPRNTVDSRISAIPRNGRSAHAGARFCEAGGFACKGIGASSRRAAAAALGGGVKGELGISEAGRIDERRQNANHG